MHVYWKRAIQIDKSFSIYFYLTWPIFIDSIPHKQSTPLLWHYNSLLYLRNFIALKRRKNNSVWVFLSVIVWLSCCYWHSCHMLLFTLNLKIKCYVPDLSTPTTLTILLFVLLVFSFVSCNLLQVRFSSPLYMHTVTLECHLVNLLMV